MRDKLILAYATNRSLKDITEDDAKKLTHVNLAFGVITRGKLDMSRLSHIREVERIRAYNPALRFVLSVGGWGAGGFSEMAMTAEGRKAFAEECLAVVEKHKLDGIDIDWEYPCMSLAEIDASPRDKENFTYLMAALREALGPDRIVSIAAGAGPYFCSNTEMDKVAEICDYIQLMTYDIRSGFEKEAGHHANTYTSAGDRLDGSAQSTVEDFAAHGVPKEKMILGAAFYSRQWDGVPEGDNHGLHMPAKTTGQGGPHYGELTRKYIGKRGFTRYWDDVAKAPWLYNGDTLISYEDPEALREKCAYLEREGLMGIMYWEHGCDDTHTLLDTIYTALTSR